MVYKASFSVELYRSLVARREPIPKHLTSKT